MLYSLLIVCQAGKPENLEAALLSIQLVMQSHWWRLGASESYCCRAVLRDWRMGWHPRATAACWCALCRAVKLACDGCFSSFTHMLLDGTAPIHPGFSPVHLLSYTSIISRNAFKDTERCFINLTDHYLITLMFKMSHYTTQAWRLEIMFALNERVSNSPWAWG